MSIPPEWTANEKIAQLLFTDPDVKAAFTLRAQDPHADYTDALEAALIQMSKTKRSLHEAYRNYVERNAPTIRIKE